MNVNDKVTIHQKASIEGASWIMQMDQFIGKTGTIKNIREYKGNKLYQVQFGTEYPFVFASKCFEEVKKEEPKVYAKAAQASDIKVGDKVKILGAFKNYQDDLSWNPKMDATIGKIGEVKQVGYLDHANWIHVTFEEEEAINPWERHDWTYLAHVLEVVKEEKPAFKVGDRVVLTHVFEGMKAGYVRRMEKAVGTEGIITDIGFADENKKFQMAEVNFPEADFWYDFECLEHSKEEAAVEVAKDVMAFAKLLDEVEEEVAALPPVDAAAKKDTRIRAGDRVKIVRKSAWKGWTPALEANIGKEMNVLVVIPKDGKKIAKVRLEDGELYPLASVKKV